MSSTAVGSSVSQFIAVVSSQFESDELQRHDLARFAVDGVTPAIAIRPVSLEQLQGVLTEAHGAGLATIAHGSGTQLGLGNVPSAYDAAVSLERMARAIDYEPADLTVTVEPGLRLRDLQELLAMSGQCLPLDPPTDEAATIGGLLATNASGPMRHAYGTARDWVIGARVVHADGTSSKSGGRVVKNVAGYDMHKLHIGALGTLGVIAQATFKLAPLPIAQTSIVIACDDARTACALALDAHDAGLSMQTLEVLSPTAAHRLAHASRWSVVARCAGGQAAIQRTLLSLDALARDAGAKMVPVGDDLWSSWSREFVPRVLSLRISVMPSAVGGTIDALDRSLAGAATRVSATVTAGLVRVQLLPASEERAPALIARASEIAIRNSGTMVIDAAPVAVKREMDVFGPPRPDLSIMKRLKEQFDPDDVLAPGRFAGRL